MFSNPEDGMGKSKTWLTVACVVLASLAAFGQVPSKTTGAGPPGESPRGQQARREMARLYLVQRMRETLALSDAQTLKVMDALSAIDTERLANQNDMRQLMDSLNTQLGDPTISDEKLKDSVAEFQRRQAKHETALRDLESKLLAVLTPRQQAQFLLLRRQLMEELREEIPGKGRQNRQRPVP